MGHGNPQPVLELRAPAGGRAVKVLDRYLLSECLPTLGISLAVFTFVLLMHRLFKLSDLVIAKGVPLPEVLHLLALALPALLPLLLPVSLLLAVFLAVGRLSADSEVIAMRACGVGLGRNARPVMILSGAVLAVTAGSSLWAQPLAGRVFKDTLYSTVKNRISVSTETGVFTPLARGITVYAGEAPGDSGELRDLFIHWDRGELGSLWILADSGRIRGQPSGLALDLTRGEMHHLEGSSYRRASFREYHLSVPLPEAVWSPDEDEQPTWVLLRAVRSTQGNTDAALELHRRLALPFSCLVFGLLGTSLGLHHARGGRSWGVSIALVVLLAYYALLTTGKALGQRGTLPPWLAMWFPNLLLGALAVYAYARRSREAPLPLEELVLGAVRWVRRRLARGANTAGRP